ncbi:MAG: hypothetical protein AVDCRST_MAG33-2215 [uncultured Thermomicrobiales bacterium]|uniref:Uncharacterized protein n=1 Tax=uncultured Thermomicrobiales bacterium TaxID=1645740 RepID=A0A6J4V6G6_9BACT|nr:MAG: hypothetical protein AVDCRST_MAG33-2215 [uncultured Thermomicrobiales bacterium]
MQERMIAEGRLPAQRLVMGGSPGRTTRRRVLGFGAVGVIIGGAGLFVLSNEPDEDGASGPQSSDAPGAGSTGGRHSEVPGATPTRAERE